MKKLKIIIIVAIAVFIVGGLALRFWPLASVSVTQAQKAAPSSSQTSATSSLPSNEYPQLSLKTMSREEATRLSVERLQKDPLAEGKVPLDFYGKVVDENNQPIAGAKVKFDWNTIGVPGGTAFAETLSDGNGLFSLTNQHGKILGVRVEKEGYYTVEGGLGTVDFEYANPSSPYWYEPDSANPVVFHLRKKGEGTELFSKSLVVPINQNHPQRRIDLIDGSIKPDGVLIITADTSKSLPGNQAFPWTATLSMAEGGLVETDDQFPFLAPETGYTSTVTMDMTNLDRSIWRGDMAKTYYFYLPSTNTYGRITVNASSSLPINLNYVYNPTLGNRVLEPASK